MPRPPFHCLALGLALYTSWSAFLTARASTIDWDEGGGTTDWELPANWSGDVLPGSADQASIGISSVQLSSDQLIDGFSNLGGALFIANASLGVGTSGIVNTGTIQLFAGGDSSLASIFAIGGDVQLSGAGRVQLISVPGDGAQLKTGPNSRLINIDNTIRGSGKIIGNIENRGLIVADDPSAPLTIDGLGTGFTNTGTVSADGGRLKLRGAISQGPLAAIGTASSPIELDGATIHGGTVAAVFHGAIHVVGESSIDGRTVIDLGGVLLVDAPLTAHTLKLSGQSNLALYGGLTLSGDFSFDSISPLSWTVTPTSEVILTGGQDASIDQFDGWQKFEIGGSDFGIDPLTHSGNPIGFSNNFNLPTLRIGAGAHVLLTDLFENGFGTAPEALYVDNLIFEDSTSLLNLNGLNLYYNSLSGNPSQIVTSGIPEPGSVGLFASTALLLISYRPRRKTYRNLAVRI